MITEDYVSFETAKLLKENGFDERVLSFYTESGLEGYMFALKATNNTDLGSGFISRPTLQMAMKWLREVHNLYIQFVLNQDVKDEESVIENYYHFNVSRLDRFINEGGDCKWYKSYEQACEAGIKYCLENLIN